MSRVYGTRDDEASIARRLGIPEPEPREQDWAWVHAKPGQLDEYLTLCESESLTDGERVVAAEMSIQALEELIGDSDHGADLHEEISRLTLLLCRRIHLYGYTVAYWARLDTHLGDAFRVSPYMRLIFSNLPSELRDRFSKGT